MDKLLQLFFGPSPQGIFIRLSPHVDHVLKLKRMVEVDTICDKETTVESLVAKTYEEFKTSCVAFLYTLIVIQIWKGRVDFNPAPIIGMFIIAFLFFF